MNWKIPLFDTDFGNDEVEAVSSVLCSGWLTMGELVREFEVQFAQVTGVKHAIAVSNCTAALHLAYKSLGIGAGDEVICPSLSFVATANAIHYTGAEPIFADVKNLDEWLISVKTIDIVRSTKTKAICVVHYGGYPCDIKEICDYASEKGLFVVEDCAHAPGASYQGRPLGGWGDIGCFSFFSNKNMSTGEGGMITTNNDELADKVRLLRSHGMTSLTLDRHKGHAFSYDVLDFGYNYRPTEITAAIGLVQLKKLLTKNQNRRMIVKYYRQLLAGEFKKIKVPFRDYDIEESSCHIMPVLLPEDVSRTQVMEFFKKRGIQTSIHYRPIHTFSAYGKSKKYALPKTERIGKCCISLPLFPAMKKKDVQIILEALQDALKS
jgi:dTDP-4-amino-4,6-dideoxygalactose transaminase